MVSNIFKGHAIIIDLLLPLYVYIITPKVFLTQHISYLPFRFVFTLHNDQKKKYKRTNNDLQNSCFYRRINTSCSTSGTFHVTQKWNKTLIAHKPLLIRSCPLEKDHLIWGIFFPKVWIFVSHQIERVFFK